MNDGLYACTIEDFTYNDQNEIINVLGDHLTDKTDADVQVIRIIISSFSVKTVPSQLFKIFPNMEEVFMEAVGLETIHVGDFNGAEKLKLLHMSYNNLQSIESGSFLDSPNLEIVNLEGNRFVQIQEGAFEGANNIKEINLEGNRLTSLGTFFKDCPLLEVLHLSSHRFSSIEANAFDGLPILQRLYLDRSTQLISLSPEAFTGLINLKELSLIANINLQDLPALVFSPLIALERLYMVQSKLNHLEADTFDFNIELKSISLSHNMYEFDPQTFSKLTKLEHLEMRNSDQFVNLQPELFVGNVNLKTLIFYFCNITELASNTFDELIGLEELDLSFNRIILPDDIFEKNVNLKSLKLSRNSIDTMNSEILKPLLNLEVLHLDFNALTTIDSTFVAANPNLVELRLTSNRIDSIQSTFLENQQKIEILDLNANVCVDKRFFGIINGNLTEILPELAECFSKYAESTSTVAIETTTSGASFLNISKDVLIVSVLVYLCKINFSQ